MTQREPAGEAVEDLAAECATVRAEIGERVDRVATVTVDRPDAHNALDATVRRELKSILPALEADERTKDPDAT